MQDAWDDQGKRLLRSGRSRLPTIGWQTAALRCKCYERCRLGNGSLRRCGRYADCRG